MKKWISSKLCIAAMFITILLLSASGANIQAQNTGFLAFAEKMPEVKGGLPSLYKSIQYPEIAAKAGVQGKVFLMAFIDENGKVSDVKIIKGIGAGCDEAAIDAIKKASFSPGSNKGTPVKVKMALQISFSLKS